MKTIFYNFINFVSFAAFGSPDIDQAWFVCKAQTDCALARGRCGEVRAINQNFLVKFENQMRETDSCRQTIDFDKAKKETEVECVEGKCRVCSPAGSNGRCRTD